MKTIFDKVKSEPLLLDNWALFIQLVEKSTASNLKTLPCGSQESLIKQELNKLNGALQVLKYGEKEYNALLSHFLKLNEVEEDLEGILFHLSMRPRDTDYQVKLATNKVFKAALDKLKKLKKTDKLIVLSEEYYEHESALPHLDPSPTLKVITQVAEGNFSSPFDQASSVSTFFNKRSPSGTAQEFIKALTTQAKVTSTVSHPPIKDLEHPFIVTVNILETFTYIYNGSSKLFRKGDDYYLDVRKEEERSELSYIMSSSFPHRGNVSISLTSEAVNYMKRNGGNKVVINEDLKQTFFTSTNKYSRPASNRDLFFEVTSKVKKKSSHKSNAEQYFEIPRDYSKKIDKVKTEVLHIKRDFHGEIESGLSNHVRIGRDFRGRISLVVKESLSIDRDFRGKAEIFAPPNIDISIGRDFRGNLKIYTYGDLTNSSANVALNANVKLISKDQYDRMLLASIH